MINVVLHDLLAEVVVAYIQDILIYTETELEHVQQVQKVLQQLREATLCGMVKKSSFHGSEVEYLGYQISSEGIDMSLDKVKAAGDWPTQRNLKKSKPSSDLQTFTTVHRQIQ